MVDYVAVAEAVRLAGKQTTLLREVMTLRAQAASSPQTKAASASAKQTENVAPRK